MNNDIRTRFDHVRQLAVVLIAGVVSMGAASHACGLDEDDDGYIARQAVIRLGSGMTISEFNSQYGTTTLRSIGSRKIYLVLLPVAEGEEEEWLADLVAAPPSALRWAELNYEGQDGEGRTGSFYVSDVRGGNRYNNQYARDRLRLAEAHTISTGGGTIVAVLDTGVDAAHPLLAGRIAPGGYNYVNGNTNTADVGDGVDNDGDGDIDESLGHGTFVAGLVTMVAPDAQILPIKVLDSDGRGAGFGFAAGIYRALDRGADVINMSLGSTYSAQALEDALFEARVNGVVVVGAAGNQGSEVEEFPAMKSNGFGVVAVDRYDVKAGFSSYNQDADLSAPGVAIYSSIPENAEGHTYARWHGTSMAAPMVAGAAALLLSQHPDWPDDHSRHALVSGTLMGGAVDIEDLNPSFAGMMGAGRLDAAGALAVAEPDVAWITQVTLPWGERVSGGVTDLLDDGDTWYISRSEFDAVQARNVVETRIFFTTPGNPGEFDLEARTRLNSPGGVERIEIRDWVNGGWVLLEQNSIGTTWQDSSIEIANAEDFIRPSDGRIIVRITHSVLASFGSDSFRSYIDLAEIDME
jgi:subtilisin family serine protease